MAERGARPQVHPVRRTLLRAARSLTSPLLPDDYIELINPLWSTRELRGIVERITHEADDAVTVEIRPGHAWPGHEPGQYLRIGIEIDGRKHWRAYSLTSDPAREDGWISITVKRVEEGVVSRHLVEHCTTGTMVSLGGVEGEFGLPDPLPPKILYVSAGSGITPIMSMLRALERRGELRDVVHLHSARTYEKVIFGDEMRAMADRHPGFALHEQHTGEHGRMGPQDLDRLCPDWRERECFASGPGELLDSLKDHFEEAGLEEHFHFERFQPVIGTGDSEVGEGGSVKFLRHDDLVAEAPSGTSILVAGEQAGAELPFGCRMGICHTCIGRLMEGRLRDLRTGEVHGDEGSLVRTCVNAPEGAVEIDL